MLNPRSVTLFVLGLFILSLMLATGTTVSSSVSAQDDPVRVVASFSILADIAAQVAGDVAEVETLIPLGANPHAYEPSARDVVTLSDADAVLVVGINFEEGLLPVVEESAGERMVVVSNCVPVRPIVSRTTHDHEDDAAHDDHDHEGEHDDEDHDHHSAIGEACEPHYVAVSAAFGTDEEYLLHGTLGPLNTLACGGHEHDDEDEEHDGEHTHEAGSCDPHVWTDPVNAGFWALAVRDTLIALDPAHEAVYTANADAYLGELAAVAQQVQDQIETIPEDRRYIVTNHLAFNYFTERFGLTLVGVVIPGGSTTSEPSVQEVLNLIEVVQEYNVPAIFTETTVSEDLAQQIADETGAGITRLYTGSLSEAGGEAGTYIDYLLFNAAQMVNALQ